MLAGRNAPHNSSIKSDCIFLAGHNEPHNSSIKSDERQALEVFDQIYQQHNSDNDLENPHNNSSNQGQRQGHNRSSAQGHDQGHNRSEHKGHGQGHNSSSNQGHNRSAQKGHNSSTDSHFHVKKKDGSTKHDPNGSANRNKGQNGRTNHSRGSHESANHRKHSYENTSFSVLGPGFQEQSTSFLEADGKATQNEAGRGADGKSGKMGGSDGESKPGGSEGNSEQKRGADRDEQLNSSHSSSIFEDIEGNFYFQGHSVENNKQNGNKDPIQRGTEREGTYSRIGTHIGETLEPSGASGEMQTPVPSTGRIGKLHDTTLTGKRVINQPQNKALAAKPKGGNGLSPQRPLPSNLSVISKPGFKNHDNREPYITYGNSLRSSITTISQEGGSTTSYTITNNDTQGENCYRSTVVISQSEPSLNGHNNTAGNLSIHKNTVGSITSHNEGGNVPVRNGDGLNTIYSQTSNKSQVSNIDDVMATMSDVTEPHSEVYHSGHHGNKLTSGSHGDLPPPWLHKQFVNVAYDPDE